MSDDAVSLSYSSDLSQGSFRGRIILPSVFLHEGSGFDHPLCTEALFGEEVFILGEVGNWARVRLLGDSYEGHVPLSALGKPIGSPNYYVRALRTYIYSHPDIKSVDLGLISMNSPLVVEEIEGRFARLASGAGYVIAQDIVPSGKFAEDFVSVAMLFMNTPYRWAGRTSLGIDCSGLVQMALKAAGHHVPRDTMDQEQKIGDKVSPPYDKSVFRRGDLIFWKRHIGILVDSETLLHSSGKDMRVVVEPLADYVIRMKENTGAGISSVRRLSLA